MTFVTHSAEETIQLGKKIGSLLQPGAIIAMEGNLAAGKTTITKGIAKSLGIEEAITSPTFTLISEYEGKCPSTTWTCTDLIPVRISSTLVLRI